MPPRLNKRQLREQEELAELEASRAAAAPLAESDDDEEEAALSTGRGGAKQELRSAFGAVRSAIHGGGGKVADGAAVASWRARGG